MIQLSVPHIRESISGLRSAASVLKSAGFTSAFTNLSTFSPVSGLDMAGRTHGTISGDYEPKSTKALASHMRDTAALLESNLNNTVMADVDFSSLVSAIGAGKNLGLSQAMGALSQPAPAPALVNAKTGRFANAVPVAGPQFSLPALNSLFTSTIPATAAAAATQWASTAATLTEAVGSLEAVKASLATSAATGWVQNALARVNRIQWAGGTYAAHAGALAAHTGNLAAVAQANQISTAVAHGTWMMIPSPDQKMLFEQAFLAPFAGMLTTSLAPTNPGFNQLLPALSDMPGDRYDPVAVSVPQAPEFERTRLPAVVARALADRGFGDLARASTPTEVVEQFGEVNPDALNALAAGATPTQAAAVTAPHMPPTLSPGLAAPAATAAPGGLNGLPLGGMMSVPALQGANAAGLGNGAGNGTSTGAGRGAGSASGANPFAAGLPAAGGGVGGASGSARNPAAAPFGLRGPGAANGSAGLSPRGTTAPLTGVGASGAGRGYPLGGPLAAGPGHAAGGRSSRGRKANRVKAVTSAVERDGNLRALLGQAPAVLPGVIGHNVQQPRRG